MGYEAVPASSLQSALAPVGSHGWSGKSMDRAPFSVRQHRSFQGLTLVCGVPAAGSRASDTCQPKASLPEGAFCRALKSLPQIEIRAALRHTTIIHSSLFIIH